MTIHIASSYGVDLSSRVSAVKLRHQLQASKESCIIDLEGVRTISASFADEAFAILFLTEGEDWFRRNIRFINSDENSKFSILAAIHERCGNTKLAGQGTSS